MTMKARIISLFLVLFLLFVGTAKSQDGELTIATPDLSTFTCEVGEVQTFIWKYNYTLDGFDKECDNIDPESIELSIGIAGDGGASNCLLYTSPSPRDATLSRMPSSA